MEKHVFTDPEVRATFLKFVVVKLFCDEKYGPNPDERAAFNSDLEERLTKSSQQPQYAVMDPETRRVVGTWGYDRSHLGDPQLFIQKMNAGLDAVKFF